MDYTWNWLAGALTLYREGSRDLRTGLDNAPGLVENNQEDIDALIVAGNRLVMIEVKWHGAWSTQQLESKAKRISAFAVLAERVRQTRELHWNVVLASRHPTELKREAAELEQQLHALGSHHPIAKLPLGAFYEKLPSDLLEVPYVKKGSRWAIAVSRRWVKKATAT